MANLREATCWHEGCTLPATKSYGSCGSHRSDRPMSLADFADDATATLARSLNAPAQGSGETAPLAAGHTLARALCLHHGARQAVSDAYADLVAARSGYRTMTPEQTHAVTVAKADAYDAACKLADHNAARVCNARTDLDEAAREWAKGLTT